MKRKYIISIVILAIIGAISFGVYNLPKSSAERATEPLTSSQAYSQPTVEELLRLVNEERAKNGVSPLVLDERLNKSAQMKADDMVKFDYFAHVNPNTGKHGYEYINEVGIHCTTDGENLSWTSDKSNLSSLQAVNWWIGSKPHHDAMISAKNTVTGFGVDNYVIVEHFCQQ